MHKVLIASTDPSILTWKSLEKKRKTIEDELNTIKNGSFKVFIVGCYVQPEVKDGRITHNWFNTFSYPLYREGYDFVLLHMSEAQKKKWKIQPTLRGASQIDTDFVGEMYLWADENTKRGKYNQFIETCLHEIRHELCRGTGVNDDTHTLHDKKSILGQFKQLDMKKYLPIRQELLKERTRLEKLLAHLRTLLPETPQPFLKGTYRISQKFGEKSKIYKQTGTHIGTDFATPVWTKVYAPLSGTLKGTYGTETGLMATLSTKRGTYQFLHLGAYKADGVYAQGDHIGYTGNTGLSTGPHVCVRYWFREPNIAVLTKDNIDLYLADVTKIK